MTEMLNYEHFHAVLCGPKINRYRKSFRSEKLQFANRKLLDIEMFHGKKYRPNVKNMILETNEI